jgi:hypothetical protein
MYASALLMLFYSSCFFVLKILIIFFLVAKLLQILINPRPYPDYQMLSYNKTGWCLHDQNQQELLYEKAVIVIDAGLFFLLRLTEAKKSKYLVVFFDQIDEESYRLLNIMQKIS